MRSKLLILALMFSSLSYGQGLISVNDHIRDYARLLQIQGKPVNNPITLSTNQTAIWEFDSIPADSLGHWGKQLAYYQERNDPGLNLYLLSPQVDYNFNSKYARTYNDGPMWTGRGHTVGLNAGFKVKWGPISGQLYPNFYHAQNKYYQIQSGLQPNQTVYNYQLSDKIDWVQLYGLLPVNEFDWGQSNISATVGPVKLNFANENLWIGSSVMNPILMGNTAPGFPHITLGSARPVRTKYGDFELNWLWGQLYKSDWFDRRRASDGRFITGMMFGYRPSFSPVVKGLSIGLSRILYKRWPEDGFDFSDMFLVFKNVDPTASSTPGGPQNDETDQFLGLDLRWFLEKSSSEFYFEWVRNDFWLNFQDLVMEPEHGSYFTLGFQKLFKGKQRDYRFRFEHTSLAVTRTREIRTSSPIYSHSVVIQGYTHRGQLLGAPIGPGAKNQLIQVDRIDENGKFSFGINRIRFNDDYFWQTYGPTGDFLRHDVEWNFALEGVRFFKNYEFSGKFIYSRRMNMHYYHDLDVNNFQFVTSVRYHIMGKPLLTLFD